MNGPDTTWLKQFPALAQLQDPAWLEVLPQVQHLSLPAGMTAFQDGGACQAYLLVLEGSVRVQKLSESGKEIVLYRVEAGQSCILTTACLLARDNYHAEAVTETPVSAVALPRPAFDAALASEGFRRFVFDSYGSRITGLLSLIDAIVFGRMDERLMETLMRLADANGQLRVTHQELARELGTAREVVSRLLKDFERRGQVELERGLVRILK